MAAPKCKICGKSHYGMCNPKDLPELSETDKTNNHVIPEKTTQSIDNGKAGERSGQVEKPTTTAENPSHNETESKGPAYDRNAPARVKRWRESNREEYNRYMREYRRRKKEAGG